jgi:hypothetical protein
MNGERGRKLVSLHAPPGPQDAERGKRVCRALVNPKE